MVGKKYLPRADNLKCFSGHVWCLQDTPFRRFAICWSYVVVEKTVIVTKIIVQKMMTLSNQILFRFSASHSHTPGIKNATFAHFMKKTMYLKSGFCQIILFLFQSEPQKRVCTILSIDLWHLKMASILFFPLQYEAQNKQNFLTLTWLVKFVQILALYRPIFRRQILRALELGRNQQDFFFFFYIISNWFFYPGIPATSIFNVMFTDTTKTLVRCPAECFHERILLRIYLKLTDSYCCHY